MSLFLRPILALGNAVCAAVKQINLIEVFAVAHFHHFGFEIFHSRVGTPVLATLPCICRSVHVREQWDFLYSQTVYDNMNVDIAAVVMTIGVGTDKCLVSAKMRFAKFLA